MPAAPKSLNRPQVALPPAGDAASAEEKARYVVWRLAPVCVRRSHATVVLYACRMPQSALRRRVRQAPAPGLRDVFRYTRQASSPATVSFALISRSFAILRTSRVCFYKSVQRVVLIACFWRCWFFARSLMPSSNIAMMKTFFRYPTRLTPTRQHRFQINTITW
jgi:hypothetical protein